MDVEADIRAPALATLDLYCDRVASAVGRLSACAFGMPEKEGKSLAHHLGRALQLTNILRDLDEDAVIGRLYLPREDLRAAGIDEDEPRAVLAHPALAQACAPVIAQGGRAFRRGGPDHGALPPRKRPRANESWGTSIEPFSRSLEGARFRAAPPTHSHAPSSRFLLAILRYGLF